MLRGFKGTSHFHISSMAISNYRISRACLCWQSDNAQKSVMFSDCLPKQKCNNKLYMVPCRAIAYHHGALEESMICQNNRVFSSVWPSNKLQRSKKSLDSSTSSYASVKDLESQLEELFNEVKMMVKTGNKRDAEVLLRANYEAVKERINEGTKGTEEAATLDVLALGYMAIGDLKFADYLLGLLIEVVDSLKDNEPLLDSILVHMGSMYSNLDKFEKSVILYERAISILETKSENSTFIVTPLLGMAKALGCIGKCTEAVEAYHRALALLQSSRGSESEALVIPLFGLGNLLLKEGKATDAEASFIRILGIYKKIHGENDGRVGMVMSTLARIKCATGNEEEAIRLYRKALQIIKDSNYLALDDSAMEKMRIELAERLHLVGRTEEGREVLEECLLITEEYKGKNHPSAVTHLINLATSYSRSKNFVEAERLLRTSLEIMTKTVKPDDQSITIPMLHLAATLCHLRRCKEAEPLALEVLRIREKACGQDSLPVAEALDCLVLIHSKMKRDDNLSLERLKRVLSIQEKELGYDCPEVMLTLNKILYLMDKLGKNDEKLPLQRRLSSLTMRKDDYA